MVIVFILTIAPGLDLLPLLYGGEIDREAVQQDHSRHLEAAKPKG
jgi:hypothetical protein